MRAELQKLYSGLDAMSREELVLSFRRLIEECSEKDARLEIAGSAATEMSRQFQQIKDENAALKKENKELLRQNRKLTDQLRMRSRDLFGRSSEQTSGIVDAILDENPEDPALESAPEPEQTDRPDHEEAEALEKELERQRGKRRRGGKKTPGKRREDLSKLPTKTDYARSSPSIPSSTTNVRIVPLSLSGWSTAL